MLYATQTRSRSGLTEMKRHGFGLLMTPESLKKNGPPVWLDNSTARFCIDNGAWSAYKNQTKYEVQPFLELVDAFGQRSDFVILPDIVGGGIESLDFSLCFLELNTPRKLIAVQDGMTPNDVRQYLSDSIGIAVGGTTEWKENTLRSWGKLAAECVSYLHVLRVNTRRRLKLCHAAGANSIDGTSATRFPKTAALLSRWNRELENQLSLEGM